MIAVVNRGVDRYDRLGKGRDPELSDHSVPNRSAPSKLYSTLATWRSMFEALPVLARRRHCAKLTVASERPDTKFSRWLPHEVRWTNWKRSASEMR